MTLANRITIFRLVLVPVFVAFAMSYDRHEPWLRWAALATFVIAAISDGVDGFIARQFNQRTRLGAILDPIADKLLVNLAFVFLAVNDEFHYVPGWFPVIMIGRDAIIVLGSYLIHEIYGRLEVHPRISGKLNTVFQMVLIISILMQFRFTPYILYTTLVLSVFSFFMYLNDGIRQLGNEDEARKEGGADD